MTDQPMCVRCDHPIGHHEFDQKKCADCDCQWFIWPGSLQGDAFKIERALSELGRAMAADFLKVVNRILAWLLRRI